jgi:hypothetical protein
VFAESVVKNKGERERLEISRKRDNRAPVSSVGGKGKNEQRTVALPFVLKCAAVEAWRRLPLPGAPRYPFLPRFVDAAGEEGKKENKGVRWRRRERMEMRRPLLTFLEMLPTGSFRTKSP